MKHLLSLTIALAAPLCQGQPTQADQLQLRLIIDLASDAGFGGNSTFNPRIFDGFNYVNQIVTAGFGRYPSGSPTPSLVVNNNSIPLEHRMVAPFRGTYASSFILGSSSGATLTTTFSRYNYDGSGRVDATTPDNQTAEGFDWVDDDTIVYSVYNPSSSRKRLYLVDVAAKPFGLTLNTAWSSGGYINTSVGTRIRNVRVGDVYHNYAYYGDGNQVNNPNFYAVNLTTGAEMVLGNAGALNGSGSFGVWTVLERGGYLYVQTTDNGIQVYSMTDAVTLGARYATYDKASLDAITGYSGQYFGLDVTPDGTKMLLGATGGRIFEFGPPILGVARSEAGLVLSWPASVTAVSIQASPTLSASEFLDLEPQPGVAVNGKQRSATVPITDVNTFFRLRKSP